MAQKTIACVVGARPNFIKMAAILNEIGKRRHFDFLLIHTGQHYSADMSQTFFEQLELPEPHVNLGVGGGSQTQQTAGVMSQLEPLLVERRPALALVVGDVNSTVATALVAAKLGIPIAHVEAGLRSFDRQMPEEINRVVTDVLSDYLFASEPSGVENLRREGVPDSRVFLVGNVMIDTLLRFREKARQSRILAEMALEPGKYAVATLHRPSNVDDPVPLQGLLTMLQSVSVRLPVIFPVHPRTRKMIDSSGLNADGIRFCPPLGYLDFMQLLSEARLVLTDSGGIQEETTILRVPCLTLRENTERPATIEQGTNKLVGVEPSRILECVWEELDHPLSHGRVPDLWDGKASERILDVLEAALQ
jgi:UDP-N-acetylglucosamine 2-epimerase (non-hydrolysing)